MTRINDFKVAENFKLYEFECNHCRSVKLDPALVNLVQRVRNHFGRSVTINSGYRCPEHNRKVGGATDSQHLHGKAADIVVSGVSPSIVADFLEPYADGLGRYRSFTHCDVRGYKARWDNR